MFKQIIAIFIFCFGVQSLNAQQSEDGVTLFAQGMYPIEDTELAASVENVLYGNPNVKIVRLDNNSGRFLVLTKNISELTEAQLRSWFGELGESLNCIQIGVHGVDKRNSFPFTECND